MRYGFLILVVFFLYGCLNDRPTRFDHTEVEKPVVEKEEPIKVENRHIWQRPDFVLENMGDIEGKTIADLGAGSGYFAVRFLKSGANVIALEIDPKMIDIMNSEATYLPDSLQDRFEARLAGLDDSKLLDDETDLVFVANTYIYIENRVDYFRKLASRIKSGGQLMIVDFKKKNTPLGPPLESRVGLGQVEEELTSAGYQIIQSDDTSLKFQYVVIASPLR